MNGSATPRSTVSLPVDRIAHALEGPAQWGRVDLAFTRYGLTRIKISIYPPRTDLRRRVRLQAWRMWVSGSVATWLALLIGCSAIAPTPMAFLAASAIHAALSMSMRISLRRDFAGVLQLSSFTASDDLPACVAGRSLLLERCVSDLRRADADLADGRITQVQYDRVWESAYGRAATCGR